MTDPDGHRTVLPVSEPFLPDLAELVVQLRRAWDAGTLTNHGLLARELEQALRARLSSPGLSLVANGTLALHLALHAMDIQGEVITTPFSFAATVTSVLWERCTPVFADIDPATLNLDPIAVRGAVTSRTRAILATHVYGNPCDVVAFERLGAEVGCPVIYDAAHAFDVRVGDRSILSFGDASAMSFHATKVFHTAEGGAVSVRDEERRGRVERLRNFGQSAPGVFAELGTNAKLSELHAAVGLVVLAHMNETRARRAATAARYDAALGGDSPTLRRPAWHPEASRNYAYYPLLLQDEARTLATIAALAEHGYQARRYFYPALHTLPYAGPSRPCPVALDAARRVLCLPLHASVGDDAAEKIAALVLEAAR